MRLSIKILGKEFIEIQLGEPPNNAPDYTSTPVGFTSSLPIPKDITIPERDSHG